MKIREYIKKIINYALLNTELIFNSDVKDQLNDPYKIPIIIINYNQLLNLKTQVDFYLQRGFQNIIIIDNNSTYEPLLEFYAEMRDQIIVERLNENFGHRVLFNHKNLLNRYCKGFFVLTDADIVPNENLPSDFMQQLLKILLKYKGQYLKVGYALDLESIPDHYTFKTKVIKWEDQYWLKIIDRGLYDASIDTTFALYLPNYPIVKYKVDFFKGIRVAENFTALHGGWYIDYNNMTQEEEFYLSTASNSSSWKMDENNLNIDYMDYIDDEK